MNERTYMTVRIIGRCGRRTITLDDHELRSVCSYNVEEEAGGLSRVTFTLVTTDVHVGGEETA
jgi:hypothetical protein